MKRLYPGFAQCFLMASLIFPAMSGQAGETVWRWLPPLIGGADSRFHWVDLDGDGIKEIVVNARNNSAIGVIGQTSEGFKLIDAHVTASASGRLVAVEAAQGGASTFLFGFGESSSGVLQEFSGKPPQVVREQHFSFPVLPWAASDIDGDGDLDVLVSHPGESPRTIRLLDYATGQVKWSRPIDGPLEGLSVAQLDDDPALEIILVGSTPGLILAGDDGSTEWSHQAGFAGWEAHIGRFQVDPDVRTFAIRGVSTVVFRSDPYAPLYNLFQGAFSLGDGALHDVNADGLDEIVFAPSMIYPSFRAHEMGAGQQVVSWPSVHSYASAPSFGRVEAESQTLIAYTGRGFSHPVPGGIEIKAFPSGESVYSEPGFLGPFNNVAAADVDGDGEQETIFATLAPAANTGPGRAIELRVFAGGGTEPVAYRRLEAGSGDGDWSMTVADLDGEGADDLVILAKGGQRLLAVDGATLETRWQREVTPKSDLAALRGRTVTSADFNGDGVSDVALLIEDAEFGHRLAALAGATGTTLWKSLAMPGSVGSRPILVANVDSDAADEVIVTLGYLMHVFDAVSKQIQWIREFENDGAKSAVLASPWPACTLGILGSEVVRFFDCYTRSIVQTVNAPRADVLWPADPAGNVLLYNDGRMSMLKRAGQYYFHAAEGTNRAWMSAVPERMFPAGRKDGEVDLLVDTGAYPARIRFDVSDAILRSGFQD